MAALKAVMSFNLSRPFEGWYLVGFEQCISVALLPDLSECAVVPSEAFRMADPSRYTPANSFCSEAAHPYDHAVNEIGF